MRILRCANSNRPPLTELTDTCAQIIVLQSLATRRRRRRQRCTVVMRRRCRRRRRRRWRSRIIHVVIGVCAVRRTAALRCGDGTRCGGCGGRSRCRGGGGTRPLASERTLGVATLVGFVAVVTVERAFVIVYKRETGLENCVVSMSAGFMSNRMKMYKTFGRELGLNLRELNESKSW